VRRTLTRSAAVILVSLPLGVLWVLFLIVPGIAMTYADARLLLRRWDWFVLASPAFYVFLASSITKVLLPLQAFLAVPAAAVEAYRQGGLGQGWRAAASLMALILVVVVGAHVVSWGAFPLEVDDERAIHIRMIPFFPWPAR
jgi:hypothetical protein